ncbi:MAG: histidine phosphotransferase [Xanthobacteraceae bacterium]|nr:histidine phosphotransferase [Xanthobacteraceae bacterium]
MSGTSGVAPDALDLAALLCSRVCHDLINPVGAIVNGLEVLDSSSKAEDRDFALDLIRKSAASTSSRLQFCRIAYGAAGSAGTQIDLGEAQKVARGHLEDEKTKLIWNLPHLLMAKNRVKLLLNMLVIAQQAIPRGGELTADPLGEGENMGFRIRAAGQNAREPHDLAVQLNVTDLAAVNAHAVQPYYTALLARSCGLAIAVAAETDAVMVTAS